MRNNYPIALSLLQVFYLGLSAVFLVLFHLVQEEIRLAAEINPHASREGIVIYVQARLVVLLIAAMDIIVIAFKAIPQNRQLRSSWLYAYVLHSAMAILLILRSPVNLW